MKEIALLLQAQDLWIAESLKEAVSALITAKEQNFGAIMNTLRLSLVGGSFGPDLFTIIEIIGKDETVSRINNAVLSLNSW